MWVIVQRRLLRTYNLQTAAITHPGLMRAHNEDAYYVSPDQRLLVVADGMGGEVGGAVASKLAVETLENLWTTAPPDMTEKSVKEWMINAVDTANSTICNVSQSDPRLKGMGTTIIFAVLCDGHLMHIAHVGDSRAYLLRGKLLKPITRDHSTVQDWVDEGKVTVQEARRSPHRNLLTRCLGYERQLRADFTVVKIQADDQVVLCSDGLPMVVEDEDIAMIGNQCSGPDEFGRKLIDATLKEGAPDNVTVVVAKFAK